MQSLVQGEMLIFGGTNPEIEQQFIYKVDFNKNDSYLISQMNNYNNEKSCLYKNKILVFGVSPNLTQRTIVTNVRSFA